MKFLLDTHLLIWVPTLVGLGRHLQCSEFFNNSRLRCVEILHGLD